MYKASLNNYPSAYYETTYLWTHSVQKKAY